MRNPSFGPYLLFWVFGDLRGPKSGRGPTHAHIGLGSQNPTKKLTHWVDLLRQPLTRNHVSEVWRPEPPPPLNEAKSLLMSIIPY